MVCVCVSVYCDLVGEWYVCVCCVCVCESVYRDLVEEWCMCVYVCVCGVDVIS